MVFLLKSFESSGLCVGGSLERARGRSKQHTPGLNGACSRPGVGSIRIVHLNNNLNEISASAGKGGRPPSARQNGAPTEHRLQQPLRLPRSEQTRETERALEENRTCLILGSEFLI